MQKRIYNLTPEEVLKKFNASLNGLSEEELKARLKIYGWNQIEKKARWKWLKLIFNQFNDALVLILLVAAFLALLFHEYRDVTIILIIVFINALIGFFQEFKAERILDSIKKFTTDKALVIRGSIKKEIDSRWIVPGDIIFLTAGDNIPADGYLLESYGLRVNSFIFTGESKPETKSSKVLADENIVLADVDNMIFMGETVTTGEGRFVVTATGMNTELGKIAGLTQKVKDELTPLQKQMRKLGKDVTILAVLIGILVMIAGQYFKLSLYENFLFALALAVSVVPEGLPAAISVALSLGMKRLLKSNVLAKKLNAVETLGSVSAICTDKTGTITKNELTVTKIIIDNRIINVTGEGYKPEGKFSINGKIINAQEIRNFDLLFKIGTLCNDASLVKENGTYKILGDPTEGAIIVAGKKFNPKDGIYEIGEYKINENPFSPERRKMSVVFRNKNTVSYVKGSPDVMLDLCVQKMAGDKIVGFTQEEKEKVKAIYNEMSSRALRVLAFAYRNLDEFPENKYLEESERNLIWVGMMTMIDPPRRDVARAIGQCRSMGIRVIMITGDYEVTARAIAEQIKLINRETEQLSNDNLVINGKTLNTLSDKEIYNKIKNGARVFARIAPEQKLRIANILKNNHEVIAMTGDGVNDAPALKRADIGVAMGIIGTDVSKEASDMILLDDNFASIVEGIKEGRTIFQNLKKFVHYVFTSNGSELFTVVFGVLLGIPSPITAIQILATDLGTDIFPSFSLGIEPAEPDLPARLDKTESEQAAGEKNKIISSKQKVMTWKGFRRIIYIGVIMATGAVAAFVWSMLRGGWYFGESIVSDSLLYIQSTTAAYAVISMTQMANLLQSRSENLSPFKLGFFKNKYAIGAIFISVGILLSFIYLPFFQKYLHMHPIVWQDWLIVIVTTLLVFLWEEARKAEER
ncbi:MAG: cation-transporting P-type ATPase [Candidatus Moranbacteria bacterium]|nr:cation-transporting P-type ATPase [Candidatus Moranbacteria bacterium]